MEVNELKNTWTVLEEQLKKNELLNKQVIQEMTYKKSNKSLNRLINIDFLGLMVMLLLIPVIIWLYRTPAANILALKILCVFALTCCVLSFFWYPYKLNFLMKINFSKAVKQNMYAINKYIILLKWEKLATYFVIAPILGLSCAFFYYEVKASFALWIFLVIILVIAIVGEYWLYTRYYDTNIQSLRKSLEEIKELEEEE
jgi:hypothetical protein